LSSEGESEKRLPLTGWPANDDDWRWETQAAELQHTSLERVRESAGNWAASISALLGILGIVAFVKGPETFSGASTRARSASAGLILLAAALAVVSFLLATLAAQGAPRVQFGIGGAALKRWSQRRAKRAVNQLRWSRSLAVVAVVLVFAATAVTWFSTFSQRDRPVPVVAIFQDGRAACGNLGVSAHGSVLDTVLAGNVRKRMPLINVRSLRAVDSCG
jgi:hypothetical protein